MWVVMAEIIKKDGTEVYTVAETDFVEDLVTCCTALVVRVINHRPVFQSVRVRKAISAAENVVANWKHVPMWCSFHACGKGCAPSKLK